MGQDEPRLIPGEYRSDTEATEFPRGPIIVMPGGSCIYFDLHMEKEAELCLKALTTR